MRRLITTTAILLTCMTLCFSQAAPRGRQNGNNRNAQRTEQQRSPQRPSGNHQSSRPANGHNRPDNNRRPGNSNVRPGNNHSRPGSVNNRPDNGWVNHRPQHPQVNNSGSNHRPQYGHGPQHGYQHNYHHGPQDFRPCPPPRPHMPAHRPWRRPTPPPYAWRPAPGWRPFNSILGIALGSAINFTINSLVSNGYNVTGYANDAVYVADAAMLNMIWPDATLYYGNSGLYASEFVYSTAGYNLNRYNSAYNVLVRTYGSPFQSVRNGNSISTTWWGPGNQFITLTFQNGIAGNGSNRFFTTLSFGI